MVFQADMAWALELIALGMGVFLLLKMRGESATCKCLLTKILTYFIIVGAIAALTCTGINAYRVYKLRSGMDGGMLRRGGMMNPHMGPAGPMNSPMMNRGTPPSTPPSK